MTFILLAKCLLWKKTPQKNNKKPNSKYCCCQKLNRSGTRGKISAMNGGLNISSSNRYIILPQKEQPAPEGIFYSIPSCLSLIATCKAKTKIHMVRQELLLSWRWMFNHSWLSCESQQPTVEISTTTRKIILKLRSKLLQIWCLFPAHQRHCLCHKLPDFVWVIFWAD